MRIEIENSRRLLAVLLALVAVVVIIAVVIIAGPGSRSHSTTSTTFSSQPPTSVNSLLTDGSHATRVQISVQAGKQKVVTLIDQSQHESVVWDNGRLTTVQIANRAWSLASGCYQEHPVTDGAPLPSFVQIAFPQAQTAQYKTVSDSVIAWRTAAAAGLSGVPHGTLTVDPATHLLTAVTVQQGSVTSRTTISYQPPRQDPTAPTKICR